MNSFEQEFDRSTWRLVLPLGPYGIQPYVRTGRGPGLPVGRPVRRGTAARLGTLAERLIAFGRRTAIGTTRQPAIGRTTPQWQRSSLRGVPRAVCPPAPGQRARRSLPEAA
jgi:hypothetical protein